MKITKVAELDESVIKYIIKRNLTKQYRKAKKYIINGQWQNVDLKLRKPKSDKIYYFRINKQFRAHCYLKDTTLIVFDIDNHQN